MTTIIIYILVFLGGVLFGALLLIGLNTAGYLVVNDTNPNKDVFSFVGFNRDPGAYKNRRILIFKIKHSNVQLEEFKDPDSDDFA